MHLLSIIDWTLDLLKWLWIGLGELVIFNNSVIVVKIFFPTRLLALYPDWIFHLYFGIKLICRCTFIYSGLRRMGIIMRIALQKFIKFNGLFNVFQHYLVWYWFRVLTFDGLDLPILLVLHLYCIDNKSN